MAINLVRRLIQLGYLTVDSAKNPSAVKSAITKYEKNKKKSKAFGEREKLASESNFETSFAPEQFKKNIITPEDLQGETLISLMGDPSDIGLLNRVGGIDVNSQAQGGIKFPQKFQDKDLAWASGEGTAATYMDKVRSVAEETGRLPISINTVMTNESMYSPRFISESVLNQLKATPKLAKKDVEQFDKHVRKEIPNLNWQGLEGGGIEQIMSDAVSGSTRAKFLQILGQSKYRDKGFPIVSEAISAQRDPRFNNSVLGDAGGAILRFDPSKELIPLSKNIHGTYSHGMQKVSGSQPQQFERLFPYREMFPDLFKQQATRLDKRGRPLTVDQAIKSGDWSKSGFQKADQKWVDRTMAYLERMKGKPEGLLGAGGVVMSPEEKASSQDALDVSMEGIKTSGKSPSQFAGMTFETALSMLRGMGVGLLDAIQMITNGMIPESDILPSGGKNPELPDFQPRFINEKDKRSVQFLGGLLN